MRGERAEAEADLDPVPTVHPLLVRAFGGLDAAGISWCMLRGEAGLGDPAGDVDLLVDAETLDQLDEVLARHEFLRLPAHSAGRHRTYIGYHPSTDRWIELDVEWAVEFGPASHVLVNWLRPALRTAVAADLLSRRRRQGQVWVLDPDDAFWALLLHRIVDKRVVTGEHARRLRELAANATSHSALASVVADYCPPGWDPQRVLDSARHGRWMQLLDLGRKLPSRATSARPIALRVAALGRGLSGLATAVLQPSPGLSVALIGPDGAGKSTLTEGLANSTGLPTRRIYMGLWQGEGETGDPVPLAAAILAAARRPVRSWRRAAVALYHQGRGRTVVFDRHPYDALLPPGPPHLRLKQIFFGFLARSVPPPSIVLVLDLPAEITHQRRPEEDPVQLATARDAYLALARQLRQAEVINADRTPDELRVEATARIWHAMVERRTR